MNRPALYCLMAAFAVLAWCGNAIIGRAAPEFGIPPIALNFWRWGAALVILAPLGIADIVRNWQAFRRGWPWFALYGFLGIFLFNTLFYIGLQTTTAIQASLIVSVLPVLVLIAAWAVFRQRMTGRQAIGAAISIPGAMLVVLQGDPARLASLAFDRGDLWVLGGVASWGGQILMLRYLPRGVGFAAFQTVAVAAGVLFTLPFYLSETFIAGRAMPVSAVSLGFIAYGGVIGGVLGFTAWNHATIRLGAQAAGYFANLYPIFTPLLAIVLLGERLLWFHLVGGAMVLIGIAIATMPARRADAAG